MTRSKIVRGGAGVFVLTWALFSAPSEPSAATRIPLRLEPVAETRLLMEGLNQPNFRGLEKIFKQEPADDDSWAFARGQALLIAETSNLLLIRPPRNAGESLWLERAADLRNASARLARVAANRDYLRSRAGVNEVANACNRCHQSFRVSTRLTPFTETAEKTE